VAREILLRFRTKNYERAKKVAEAIAERAKKTLATAKDMSGELKESVQRAQKAAQLRARGAALGKRGAAASGRDLQGLQRGRFGQLFGSVGEAKDKAEGVLGLFSGDGDVAQQLPGMISTVGQFIPGIGPFMAVIGPITEKLFAHLEERLQEELAKQEALFTSRQEEERFRNDYSRRFQEDPTFRRQQSRQALHETLREEKVLGKRVQKTTADLLTDFEL